MGNSLTRASEIAARRLAALDLLQVPEDQAAQRLGLTKEALSKLRKSKPYSDAIASISTASTSALTTFELEQLLAARATLFASLSRAINELLRMVDDPSTPPNIRLNAIRTIISRTGLTQKAVESAMQLSGPPTPPPSAEVLDSLRKLVEAIKTEPAVEVKAEVVEDA